MPVCKEVLTLQFPKKILHFKSFLCTLVRMKNYYGLGHHNLIGVIWVFLDFINIFK